MFREEAEELVVMLSVQSGHTSSSHHISKKAAYLPKSFHDFSYRNSAGGAAVTLRFMDYCSHLSLEFDVTPGYVSASQ
jgi:hypothetical protein